MCRSQNRLVFAQTLWYRIPQPAGRRKRQQRPQLICRPKCAEATRVSFGNVQNKNIWACAP